MVYRIVPTITILLCKHHHCLIPEHFHHCPKKAHTHQVVTPHSLMSSQESSQAELVLALSLADPDHSKGFAGSNPTRVQWEHREGWS